MESQPVKLVYWNIRGLSEKVRQVIEYCGVPYTQERMRVPEDREKWTNEIKPELIKKNPAITLPYLVDGDKLISESDAIIIYICHKSQKVELLGRNIDEWVQVATVHGVFKDFYRAYQGLAYGTYADQAAFDAAVKESIKGFEGNLTKFNGLLGDKEFIAGGITWIDFVVAEFLQVLNTLNQ